MSEIATPPLIAMTIFGYTFKDKQLIETALTTPSFRQDYPNAKDNQRLEFLGDAVLGMLAADELFRRCPLEKEGELTVRRAHTVSTVSLCEVACRTGLSQLLRRCCRASELPPNSKILADAVEAVIGAAYVDGGFEAARRIFNELGLASRAGEDDSDGNPKGRLQCLMQAMTPQRHPEYKLLKVEGKAHAPVFTVRVTVEGIGEAEASAGVRKVAEALAAAKLLETIKIKG